MYGCALAGLHAYRCDFKIYRFFIRNRKVFSSKKFDNITAKNESKSRRAFSHVLFLLRFEPIIEVIIIHGFLPLNLYLFDVSKHMKKAMGLQMDGPPSELHILPFSSVPSGL